MKNSILIMLSAVSLFIYTSCEKVVGEGPVVTETRNVNNFKEVSVSIGGTVNYKIDPVYKVEVSAQQNILNVLQTNIVGNQLVVKIKDGVRVREADITVNISAPYPDYINLSGSGNFNLQGMLNAAKLKANISGSGNITAQGGVTQEQDLRISGSGNI